MSWKSKGIPPMPTPPPKKYCLMKGLWPENGGRNETFRPAILPENPPMMGIPTTLISHQRNRRSTEPKALLRTMQISSYPSYLQQGSPGRRSWLGSISLEDLRIQPKQVGKVDNIEAGTSISFGEGGGKIHLQTGYDIGAEVKKNGSFCLKTNVDHKRVLGGFFHPCK